MFNRKRVYVYFANTDIGFQKIGITFVKPEKRIQVLGATVPFNVTLITHSAPITFPEARYATEIEKWFMSIYKGQRVKGEWYCLDANQIAEIKKCIHNDVLLLNIASMAGEIADAAFKIRQEKREKRRLAKTKQENKKQEEHNSWKSLFEG